jgi:hypothetical protein
VLSSQLLTLSTRGKLYEYKLPSEWQWYRQEHDDKIFRERKAKETFRAGLQYLPFFLTEAAPLPALVAYLEANQLDPVRAKELPREAWAVDKVKVEEEVAAYLQASLHRNLFPQISDLIATTLVLPQKCNGDRDVTMEL